MRGQSLYDYCMEHEDKKYLLDEWDYEKNEKELGLSPKDVLKSSVMKVYWRCNKCGEVWDANIQNRLRLLAGCPYCSGQKVLKGFNDLATTHPHLLLEWDYERNEKELGILPNETISGKVEKKFIKVYWICKTCGHNWSALITNRKRGQGCPQCAKEMKTSFPEQVIYYYLKQIYTKVKNGYRNLLRGKLELDIFIPEINTAIEYDGLIYHGDVKRDIKKNKLCRKEGIRLIRIREEGLPDIEGSVNIFRNRLSDDSLEESLKKLFTLLEVSVDVNILRDKQFIYSQYVQGKKENSLAVKFPEIAKEWHPTKNGNLTPENVSYASNKEVWWQCEKGHEWVKIISGRTTKGHGCPYCSNKLVLNGYNDLASVYPEIAKEWHPIKNGSLKPEGVSFGSGKKVWWQCEKGHEWLSVIDTRVRRNSGCPYCSNKLVLEGYNDLVTTHSWLSKEWHPIKNGSLKPEDVSFGSGKKVWWKCSEGHEWKTRVVDRVNGYNCPYCSNHRVLKGYNDLATTHSGLSKEWHPTKNGVLKPADVVAGSKNKVWWQCEKGHEYLTSVVSRTSKNKGCPYCSNHRVLKGYNDLATTHPELSKEWHSTKNGALKPADVVAGSNKKVFWKCTKCNNVWSANIISRVRGSSCPECGKKKSALSRSRNASLNGNDLATNYPELLKEWVYEKNNILPNEISMGSDKKVWWKCSNGHEWEASINSRTNNSTGCPYCTGRKVLSGFNDLCTTHPNLIKEWNYERNGNLKPEQVIKGSGKKVWWICKDCGHEWSTVINKRTLRGQGCPECAKKNRKKT